MHRRLSLAFGAAGIAAALAAVAACGGGGTSSGSLVFVSFGGAYQDAQKKAMTEPYAAKAGLKIVQDGPTDYAKIKTQVESGMVTWDVVDADPFFAIKECNKLAEPIDTKVVDTSKMPQELVSECAVPSMTYSYVLMYDKDKFADDPPQSWADFFDTKKYPGKRALQNAATGGGLEVALLADGVDKENLYPIDYDRAFNKLDTLRDDLVFWETGAQSQQMMESGQVSMLLAWSGRAYNAVKNGAHYAPQWNQNLAVYDVFMVPKGTKNKAAAMKFIAYATGPQAQAKLTENIPYAPIHADARPHVDKLVRDYLPSESAIRAKSIVVDQGWWAGSLDGATKRWESWVTG